MKKVLILFGSKSSEHEVSCKSAYNILNNIDRNKYNVKMVGIDKSGIWYEYVGDILNIRENKWLEDVNNKLKIDNVISYLKNYDVIFPMLHGKYGEDGFIQGLFEMAEVKYIGCDVLGSSIAMNKTISKKLVQSENIPIVDYVNITKEHFCNLLDDDKELKRFLDNLTIKLGIPMFVKPNQEGSSYGVTKVEKIEEIKDAILYALNFDNSVLIEKYISNKKEVESAVIEKNGELYVSTPGEVCISNEIYDYNSKYSDIKTSAKIPADISKEKLDIIKQYSKEIFKILNLSSLSRIDFFVTKDNIYFNEVNTMPGFTDFSLFPKMLISDGINYKDIISILIDNV